MTTTKNISRLLVCVVVVLSLIGCGEGATTRPGMASPVIVETDSNEIKKTDSPEPGLVVDEQLGYTHGEIVALYNRVAEIAGVPSPLATDFVGVVVARDGECGNISELGCAYISSRGVTLYLTDYLIDGTTAAHPLRIDVLVHEIVHHVQYNTTGNVEHVSPWYGIGSYTEKISEEMLGEAIAKSARM